MAKLQSRINELERYKRVKEKEVDRLREQLTSEKTRHIVTGVRFQSRMNGLSLKVQPVECTVRPNIKCSS